VKTGSGKDEVFTLKLSAIMSDEVIVQAISPEARVPVSQTQVSGETCKKINTGRDIPYIIALTPSVVTSSDAGTGIGYTNLNIRGSDIKRINVTVNGIPVNDAESHGVWWVNMPDIVSSGESVQIQRGVGTSTNGAGAFGASLNFRTLTSPMNAYTEISSYAGSFNTFRNSVRFGTGLIKDRFVLDGRMSVISSNGYIDRAFSDLKSYYLGGTWYAGKSLVKAIVFSGKEKTYQAWYGVPKDSLQTNRTFNPYTYENETDNYQQDHYQLHFSHEFNSHTTLNAALHYTRGRGYYETFNGGADYNDYGLSYTLDSPGVCDFIHQKWLDNHFYGATFSVRKQHQNITTLLGGGWNQYLGDHYGDIIWAQVVKYSGEKYRWYNGSGDKRDGNIFLKTSWLATANLNLYLDLQYRRIDYTIEGKEDDQRDISQSHVYNFFNPKAGMQFAFSASHSAWFQAGIGHREPDRGNFTDADSGKTPRPERMMDVEAGYQWRTSIAIVSANLFFMKYQDQLILTGEINNVGAPIMTNAKNSYRNGIELEMVVEPTDWLKWNLNFTVSQHRIRNYVDYTDDWDTWGQRIDTLGETSIAFSPSFIAASGITIKPFKAFEIMLTSKYVGKQFIDNTENNDRSLDPYLVNDLYLDYRLKPSWSENLSLRFSILNLLDHEYEANAWVYKYYSGGTLSVMDGYFPQAGRSFMGGIILQF
jgi:iron complex outermembrane receptor protein